MYFWIYFDRVTRQFKMDIDQIKMDIENRMLDEKTDIFYEFLKRNVKPLPTALNRFGSILWLLKINDSMNHSTLLINYELLLSLI